VEKRVQMVDVVRSRIAGVRHDLEASVPSPGYLLHASGAPLQQRSSPYSQLIEEIVGAFRSAGEGSGKHRRVAEQETLLIGCRASGEADEGFQAARVQCTPRSQRRTLRDVARVQSVQHDEAFHVVRVILQDGAHRSGARAECTQREVSRHASQSPADSIHQPVQHSGSTEGPGIRGRSRAQVYAGHGPVRSAHVDRVFRDMGGAVKVHEKGRLGDPRFRGGIHPDRCRQQVRHSESSAWDRRLRHALVGTDAIGHGRWILGEGVCGHAWPSCSRTARFTATRAWDTADEVRSSAQGRCGARNWTDHR